MPDTPAPPPVPDPPADGEFSQRSFAPPPGALDLLLVRHGQSEAFTPGRPFSLVDGQGNPALSPLGHEQGARVGARLAGEGIEAIYVTNLVRTAETAAALAEATGLEPVVEADLREVHLGEWEGGLFRQKVAEGDPIALEMMARERWDVIPGAERSEALADRVRAAIGRLASAHGGQRIAAFTHGGIISEVLRLATGARPFAFTGAENGSISQIVVVGDRWIVRRFNDTAHLSAGFATTSAPPT
ncbi:MAG: histidine phosphatase family protein [Acidimicrobiales bacterium]